MNKRKSKTNLKTFEDVKDNDNKVKYKRSKTINVYDAYIKLAENNAKQNERMSGFY